MDIHGKKVPYTLLIHGKKVLLSLVNGLPAGRYPSFSKT
jgi:hypothetical protein